MPKLDHNIGLREKRQFFEENWQKSQKIVITTSTPDNLVLKMCVRFLSLFNPLRM
jgi:hypothetical protein